MQFTFWQNIISIHQSSFLRNLAEKNEVNLIVPYELDEVRKKQGWTIPNLGRVNVLANPNELELRELSKKDNIHIFSGINAFPFVYSNFKKKINKGFFIGVILEPFDDKGILGILRKVKYMLFRIRFSKHIDFILTTGDKGKKCYISVGFKKEKIFDWGYFVENNSNLQENNFHTEVRSKTNVLFVGQINKRKNVLSLIDNCQDILSEENQLCIIGNGPLLEELREIVKGNSKILHIDNIPNSKVIELMQEYDLLVLPSLFDGWGAVVNEALQAGMQVIASENCGANVLLDGKKRGEVFYFGKNGNFREVLSNWLDKGPLPIETRLEIANWSFENISGEVAARYFESIIQYNLGNITDRPVAPWLMNKNN